jgi:hypothetical protein
VISVPPVSSGGTLILLFDVRGRINLHLEDATAQSIQYDRFLRSRLGKQLISPEADTEPRPEEGICMGFPQPAHLICLKMAYL